MDPNASSPVFRRQMVEAAGIALAATAAGPALGQIGTGSPQPQPLRDPTTKYPKRPYRTRSQPWSGLASEMEPPPDHGETSYRGSGRQAGRRALITGGDSGMGRAAAIAFAREDADVGIDYLPADEPDAREVMALIKAGGCKGLAIPGDLHDEAFCLRLVNETAHGLGGAGQPAELGPIYVQLATAEASFATGQVYGSAGGSGQP